MTQIKSTPFRALVVRETDSGFSCAIENKYTEELPAGTLLVHVLYSSLNYKDALSLQGNRGITHHFPHTPGIDAAGKVAYSDSPLFDVGDSVIITGNDLGINTPGGYGEYVRIPAEWAIKLPPNLSLREAMAFGTAGLTAALSIHRLTTLVPLQQGVILVSGATGGVGSMSLSILSKIGYVVHAITGKEDEQAFLRSLGAQKVILRSNFMSEEPKALLPSRYSGAIDTVGGDMLSQILRQISLNGVVTCCGNVISPTLQTSIYPFILRAITLIGISAQHACTSEKQRLWELLADAWKPPMLMTLCREIDLDEVPSYAQRMLHGENLGRKIIRVGKQE